MNEQVFLMRKKQIKYHDGITLIELIIAMAIIGLLAAIAIPKYADYQEKAKVNISIQDISNVALLIEAYYQDAREYPDSLADIGQNGKLDPWGTAYEYYNIAKNGKGHARKDKKLNPLNSDFDLYSMGKDKKSKGQISQKDSVDDVIRANDGHFVDLASKY
jgi:general secretion pathway protein G